MRLLLQMIYEDGTICKFNAGGPIETDLVESIVKEVLANGVTFKTRKHIENDVRCGVKKALLEFKKNSFEVVTRK